MIKVLIVEDEIMIAKRIERELLGAGFDVAGIAVDEEEALHVLQVVQIDAVILDVQLSGDKSGIDLAQKIKSFYDIPFLFLTSFSDTETKNDILNTGAIGYLLKPVNYDGLITSLEMGLANYRKKEKKVLQIRIGKNVYRIRLDDLYFVKSNHVYVELFLKGQNLIIRSSLRKILELAPPNSLRQINRSHLVNVKKISKQQRNKLEVNGHHLKVSKRFQSWVE